MNCKDCEFVEKLLMPNGETAYVCVARPKRGYTTCLLPLIEAHDKALKEKHKKVMEAFAEQCKMAYYYEFEECIPSVMADKIDELLEEYLGEIK